MIKNLTRLAVAAVVMTSLTGCYSLSFNAQGMTKPVSMSPHIGRPAQVLRHFKVDTLTWYGLGMIPFATIPGGPGFGVTAEKLVAGVLQQELSKGGDGIINLRVKQEYELLSIAIPFVVGLIPIVGGIVNLLARPIGVSVEGDVVSFKGRAALPVTGPVITLEKGGRIDMDGADVNAMYSEILAKAVKEQQASK